MRNIADLKTEFEAAFGASLNARQLWALTKFAKHVRLRARNNTAFNNFCNAMFTNARFSQVNKQRPSRYNPSIMESYPGLQITVAGQAVEGEDSED
jgi:hypothetical protein